MEGMSDEKSNGNTDYIITGLLRLFADLPSGKRKPVF
jgi:hypothetical protein